MKLFDLLTLFFFAIPVLGYPQVARCPFDERGLTLYYCDMRQWQDFTNFGDTLSIMVVERLVGHEINTTFNKSFSSQYNKKKLLAIGSILHGAEDHDVVWGTGVNGRHPNKDDKKNYRFKTLDVRAVRGPLTRQFLISLGIDCKEVYGDPALLIPRLYPEFKKPKKPMRDFIIIPHFIDESLFVNNPRMVSTKGDPKKIIEEILNSRFVIASSLHGIVVAEAFGIAARYVRLSESEPLFKYQDYYEGTSRPDFKFAKSIEEALKMGGERPPICDLEKLKEAFPAEFYAKGTAIKKK